MYILISFINIRISRSCARTWWQIYPHVALWRKAIFNFTDRWRLMLYNHFRVFDELFGESWLWRRVACSRIVKFLYCTACRIFT